MPLKKELRFQITVYKNLNELAPKDKALMLQAVSARKNAYAPYSNFRVGAAVSLANNEVVIGSNQENASYPSGLCAERVAIFHAGAKFPNVAVNTVAISAASDNYEVTSPAAPCGNCRQAMYEYEFKQKQPIRLLLMGEKGSIIECSSVDDILPLGFNISFL
jgi:cytidine deaminase